MLLPYLASAYFMYLIANMFRYVIGSIICNISENVLRLQVLDYIATLMEISKDELAELSYRNAVQLFSYQGSKILFE